MEKLSQQNNYNAVLTPYSELLQKGHANSDVMRYEMRRQWVVEGKLKGGARHIYAKRVLRMDEDSNQMTAGEMYDGRGELWRIQEIGQAPITAQKLMFAGLSVGNSLTTFWQGAISALG